MREKQLPTGNFLLGIGFTLIILGIAAIVLPVVAGTTVVFLIGGLLLLTGIVQLTTGLREELFRNKVPGIILGSITGLAGAAVLAHPLYGLEALTLVLAIFFVIEGTWKIIASFSYRPAAGWFSLFGSGVLSYALGWMIWMNWPLSGMWAIGVLVGVNLLATGCSLAFLAISLKRFRRMIQEVR